MTELLVDEITHYFISWTGSATHEARALTYRQFMFNLTYHRHQTSGTNYENAITKEDLGWWYNAKLYLDFNNGDFSWKYDNSNSSVYRNSFKHCTFLNYATVDSSYAGQSASCKSY